MDDPVCVLNNIWCKTKRGATHVSLEFAQGGARLAESVLDGAQTVLKAAQVVVDKSRVILDGAGTALTIIEKGIEHIRYVNEKVINGLEAVEYLINYGVDLAGLIMEAVSENVIDVRDCGVIDFAYSKDILESGIEIFCEVNVRGRGYKRVSRRLRLCDMFSPSKCTDIREIEHVH
ncbi:hypothetical protein DPMN_060117 [Dreissena polymorpha]|uniref:Uncharacterized protein n=1 Tax=Dreissena polymorpha TaxID=45954 RepID=A0A9D4HH75_DREPO|nr:hypothetical protein DPMN_060117 [Dreissena polymorpha]